MKNSFQILIASSNKYQSHLISTEIKKKQPASLIEILDKREAILSNLQYKDYDVLLIESDLEEISKVELLIHLKIALLEIPIIFLADSEEELLQLDEMIELQTKIIIKDKKFLEKLPDQIFELLLLDKKMRIRQNISEKNMPINNHSLVNLTASTLSHEINNPLMTILGTVELILDELNEKKTKSKVDSDLKKKIEMIQSSAEQIRTSLDSLIGISRITLRDSLSGRLIDLDKEPVLHNSRPKSF